MSDEPLGDDTKPESFDVTFSNPLFDFNDDYTLCYDNPLFDEEFEDISSLDPPELTPVIDEPTLLVTLPLPCTDVLGDAITHPSDSISNSLPTESSSLDLPLPDPKQILFKGVERFDPFFFPKPVDGKKPKVIKRPLPLVFIICHHPNPAAYSPMEPLNLVLVHHPIGFKRIAKVDWTVVVWGGDVGVKGRGVQWVKRCRGLICTDIANITRKRPKPGKNEHEIDRVHKSWEFLAKVNNGQTLGQPTK
ncbi:hypothetical protein Tco_0139521 [Tanacetum coccineum]